MMTSPPDRRKKACAAMTSNDVHSKGQPKSDANLDSWLTHHLTQLYGPVANEAIPEDLLRRLQACLG